MSKPVVLLPARRIPTSYKKGDPKVVTPTHPPKGGAKGGQPAVGGSGAGAEDLQQKLLALPEDQRQQVIEGVLAAQMLAGPEKTRELDLWGEAVADALLAVLGDAAYGRLVIKQAVATRSAWTPVKRLAEAVGLLDLPPARLLSAFHLLAEMVVRYARQTRAPLTPKLVANCCQNITALFEQSFPGYLRSGLAMLPFNMRAGVEHKMPRVRVRLTA